MRRAKLYYLRALRGKKARIAEKVERRVGPTQVVENVRSAAVPDVVEGPVAEQNETNETNTTE